MANEKRLIDANRAFEKADEVTFMGLRAEERKRHFMDLVSVILDCPTVDAVEVVHGRWIEKVDVVGSYLSGCTEVFCECSVCECANIGESPYCPNCGADMRERKDNE